MNARAGTLSGGEAQMLSIGRALMSNPRILMLDEPTQGLSPVAVKALGEAAKQIALSGLTILLVEQNVGLIRNVAHSVVLLSEGKQLQSVAVENLTDRSVFQRLLGSPSTTKAETA
jgi:branched-chain amino acid transport system ATP-binding protein